ncbi:MAG: HAMP domain-containing sensor histidine kinase [Pseudomonadales bacterium]|nr:HAMP domain-containing sensor histidine kinase [Pseudomonadales bacterium]
MKPNLKRNKLYLFLVYVAIALFYLEFVADRQQSQLPALLALIFLMVVSHEPFSRAIDQATGFLAADKVLQFFQVFVDLNARMNNFLQVDQVLMLVSDTLKEKLQASKVIFLINKEFSTIQSTAPDQEKNNGKMLLKPWPDANQGYAFLNSGFEKVLLENAGVVTADDGNMILNPVFAETGTGLLIPVIQNGQILCVMLIARQNVRAQYNELDCQMFEYLANQLAIILDRIRVYEKVMHKTVMDHAEKMQVMQSLSANIAHEMRTPLSGIRASISGLETYLPDLISAYHFARTQRPGDFQIIRENHLSTLRAMPDRIKLMIDQANAVIDMLLMNLRDNSRDKKQCSVCSAAACIEQAIDRYPFKTGERNKVELMLAQDFQFMGVESLFIYIIFNLLKNALYSLRAAQHGEISIRLERGAHFNHLLFRDSGEGIEAGIIDKIFDGFFTTKEDGTGAGLAFCKRTVISFGGEISCESVLGQYTQFRISLPVINAQPH